jgi:polysaccharide deacetylase family protein (PEP-CTERM system associated)
MQTSSKCVFSVDVEDWFHILDVPAAPAFASWGTLSSRVEANFLRLLDLFSEERRQVTCFFLGWIAEQFPHLVREAVARGHEIASHGYSHQLVYKMTQLEFRDDVRRARHLLEDISGSAVIGYRAPGFSSTEATPWFFEEVSNSGHLYDSSVFPARRGHGGNRHGHLHPYFLLSGRLTEFPVTVSEIGAMRICFFGGGYLRLFPYAVIRHMGFRQMDRGGPLIFYIHPREIDPHHPRIRMPLHRRVKSYVNLHTTERKVIAILREFPVTTFREYLFGSASELRPDVAIPA